MTRTLLSKTLVAVGIAGSALVLPLSVGGSSSGGMVVRVNNACSQATECHVTEMPYICSTYHGDWEYYYCTKGCGET